MEPAIKSRLVNGAARLGVSLDAPTVAKLGRYLELLLLWNRKINLTAITDPVQVVDRHFLDSLVVAPLLGDAAGLVDVGSGAGFPGAVLAILRPTLAVTCVESVRKKVAFLQTLKTELAPNLEPVCARHDELIRQGRTFDVAISRATWDPAAWVREGADLVGPRGALLAMGTGDQVQVTATPAGFVAGEGLAYEVGSARRWLQQFRRA